jgi:putative transposase
MARKRHTAEEIVAKLRQVDVLMAQGRQVADCPSDRGDGSNVLSMAKRVWRSEGRSGEAAERA